MKQNYLIFWALGFIFLCWTHPASADVEAKNLQLSIVRQLDFLIEKVEMGAVYSDELSRVVEKVKENLNILCDRLMSPLRTDDFNRINEHLKEATLDWGNAQLLFANVKLKKARLLLRSFAF